ncbi:MAG TPA: acyl-CoA dehydrogenase family protein [Candidatus Nanoarchaeia archaeon]|nr:acyl-CoA dehydrogenase family protein [Candidatus Nanoarchaeia archaeon]
MTSLEFIGFSEEDRLFRNQVRRFVLDERLLEEANAAEYGHRELDPRIILEAKELGFFGLLVPERYGGSGGTTTQYCILAEEISRHCFALSNIIAVHMGLASAPIIRHGSERLRQKYLPRLAHGSLTAAFAITEANAGSNIGATESRATLEHMISSETTDDAQFAEDMADKNVTARKEGDYWVLNGRKRFITNAKNADVITTMAYTGDRSKGPSGNMTMFVIETAWPGFAIGEDTGHKMGLNAVQNSDVIFEGLRIPDENMIGREGEGFRIQQETMEYGRIFLAACVTGMASEAFERALQYSKSRRINSPTEPAVLADYQINQVRLAEMADHIYSMKIRTYNTAKIIDSGELPNGLCSLTKRGNSEMARTVIDEAMRLHGGYGFLKDYVIERLYRESWIPLIYEGTNDVCKLIVARHILKRSLS